MTVTVGGSSYTTTVNADGSTWSVGVPGSVLAANGQVEASVTTLDDAGNPNTASTDRACSVDTTLPAAGISLNPIAGDDLLNAAEAAGSVTLSGTVSGDVKAGDSVTVTVGGSSYTTTVTADGSTWSVGVPGSVLAANGQVEASVTTPMTPAIPTPPAPTAPVAVDTTPPAAGISLNPIAGDDLFNAAEAAGSVTLSGTVSGDVKAGDSVTVTVGGSSYTTTVNADGST